jgi:hypothetical protein
MPQSSVDAGVDLVEYARNLVPFVEALHMPQNNEEELARRAEAIRKLKQKGGYNDDTSLRRSCCQRRLFITDSGYMGLGNYHIIERDVIAILFGLSVECVLRPLFDDPADGYAFIGEAYCHGVMNGELVKAFPKTEMEPFMAKRYSSNSDLDPTTRGSNFKPSNIVRKGFGDELPHRRPAITIMTPDWDIYHDFPIILVTQPRPEVSV